MIATKYQYIKSIYYARIREFLSARDAICARGFRIVAALLLSIVATLTSTLVDKSDLPLVMFLSAYLVANA